MITDYSQIQKMFAEPDGHVSIRVHNIAESLQRSLRSFQVIVIV